MGTIGLRAILCRAAFVCRALTLVALTVLACGCPRTTPPAAPVARVPGPLRVVATIPPLRGLVEPLLTGAAIAHDMHLLVPAGASEHGFEIPPAGLSALASADLVCMAGFGMEPQVEKFLRDHPSAARRVVRLDEFVAIPIKGDDEHIHDASDHGHAGHDRDHDHHHAADPHAWLDPQIAEKFMLQAAQAIRGLQASDAASLDRLASAQAALRERIGAVDAAYILALKKAERKTIVVAHDAYGYLARRYNLTVVPIAGLNAGEPQPGDVVRAAAVIKEKLLTTIFVEPQLSPAAARRIAEATHATVAVLDPLGDGDWFAMMRKNLDAISVALGTREPATGVEHRP